MKRKQEYTAIIELDENGEYFAHSPDFKYAYTSGKTIDEAINNLKDVVSLIKSGENKIQSIYRGHNTPVAISRFDLELAY